MRLRGGGDIWTDRRWKTETGENCPMWSHRSSTPPGPLPKQGLSHIIYSRATPLIYIVVNREKEEEEEAPILYYGNGRVGMTINDKIS